MLGLVNYAREPGSVELREPPVPAIGEEDVLFKVQAVGICGSAYYEDQSQHEDEGQIGNVKFGRVKSDADQAAPARGRSDS